MPFYRKPREKYAHSGLTPTTSTTLMTVIGDILVVGAMEATHFDAHQYALRHHGGYLGTRSREQSQNK